MIITVQLFLIINVNIFPCVSIQFLILTLGTYWVTESGTPTTKFLYTSYFCVIPCHSVVDS